MAVGTGRTRGLDGSSLRSVLGDNPGFRLLFAAQSVSVIGNYVAPIALSFAVLEITHSAAALGLVLAARSAPFVCFVLAGGVWADRFPRERVMLGSDVVSAACQGGLAVLLLTGRADIWSMVALQVGYGTASAFHRPALTGLVPQTVRPDQLHQANALGVVVDSTASILGPVLAGLLVVGLGTGTAIAVDAATFAASAIMLGVLAARMRSAAPAIVRPPPSFLRELADGWAEVASRPWLWVSVVAFAGYQLTVLSTFFVLGPAISLSSFGGAGAWSLVMVAWGVGSVLGGIVGTRLRPRRPLVVVHVALLASVPVLVALALARSVPWVAVTACVASAGMGLGTVAWTTTLQTGVPPHALSRASAFDWMGSAVLRPIGLALVGPVVVAVGATGTLMVAAGLLAGAQLFVLGRRAIRDHRGPGRAEPTVQALAEEPPG